MFDGKALRGFFLGALIVGGIWFAARPAPTQIRQPIILDPIFELRQMVFQLKWRVDVLEAKYISKPVEKDIEGLKTRVKALEDGLAKLNKTIPRPPGS